MVYGSSPVRSGKFDIRVLPFQMSYIQKKCDVGSKKLSSIIYQLSSIRYHLISLCRLYTFPIFNSLTPGHEKKIALCLVSVFYLLSHTRTVTDMDTRISKG